MSRGSAQAARTAPRCLKARTLSNWSGAISPTRSLLAGTDPLASARELIVQDKRVAAVDELKRVNDGLNADWN
jgi:hypothetical protein